eukprot:9017168-Ditylum_brightwellii.AAC.1
MEHLFGILCVVGWSCPIVNIVGGVGVVSTVGGVGAGLGVPAMPNAKVGMCQLPQPLLLELQVAATVGRVKFHCSEGAA